MEIITKNKKRRKKIVLKEETLRNLLIKRARGYSYSSLAQIFNLGFRQQVFKIIKEHRNDPEFKEIYQEIDATWAFLNRDIKNIVNHQK